MSWLAPKLFLIRLAFLLVGIMTYLLPLRMASVRFRSVGKTIILVSHDDRFYDVGDRSITLDSGIVTAETRQSIGLRAVLN